MFFHASGVATLVEDLRARFVAGTAAARLPGSAEVPHRKHRTGVPFLSLSRTASRSSSRPWRLEEHLAVVKKTKRVAQTSGEAA